MRNLVFDPLTGTVVREPLGSGPGWWAGAPSAFYDAIEDRFYIAYRFRRPRGIQPERGDEYRIAVGNDGVGFTDIWRMTKEQLDSPSIERGCLRRIGPNDWRLWFSFVDPVDSRWRIDCVDSKSPGDFSILNRRKVFTAADLGLEAIKDPWILRTDAGYKLFASVAARAPEAAEASETDLHHHADAYDTGLIRAHTGLAESANGLDWRWLGFILEASGADGAWDGYSSRMASVLKTDHSYVAYYDGAYNTANHYDEATSLAVSNDLIHWTRRSPDSPLVRSPYGLGCCRYFDAVEARGSLFVYYEFGREDGSHDLRVVKLD